MPIEIPLFTSGAGVTHKLRLEDDGAVHVDSTFDSQAFLDENVAMQNHNDGYSKSRDIKRLAYIPWALRNKWVQEEGWDAYDPQYEDRLNKVLNDSNWSKLRTAAGKV